MAIPELVLRSAVKQLDTFCRENFSAGLNGELSLSWEADVSGLTLMLERSSGESGHRHPLARFSFSEELNQWTLHYRDRQEHWCFYLNSGATLEFGRLLRAVEADPFGYFWPEQPPLRRS